MIHVVTGYTTSAFIENKTKETVVNKIIELSLIWCSRYFFNGKWG